MFHILKVRTSIDIFSTEKCKVTCGLKYSLKRNNKRIGDNPWLSKTV